MTGVLRDKACSRLKLIKLSKNVRTISIYVEIYIKHHIKLMIRPYSIIINY